MCSSDLHNSGVIGGHHNWINNSNNSFIIGGNNLTLDGKNDTVMVSKLIIANLPSSDPGVPGALFQDGSGNVKVSL